MSNKRTYTIMSSDSSHITEPTNSYNDPILKQPPTKRRRLSNQNNKISTHTLQTNTKSTHKKPFSNHNHNQNYQEHNDENHNTQNLLYNRITTKTKDTHKKNIEKSPKYQPIKNRLLTEIPSPTPSPPPSPSIMSIPIEFDDNCSNNSNQSINPKNTKRKIQFEEEINNNKTHEINNDSFDISSIIEHNHIFRDDEANGIYDWNTLRRRKAFRNYVLCNLNDDKPRITSICFIFGLLFTFCSVLNLFYFEYYDTMNVLLALIIILSILRDLSNCNGDGGLSIIIILTFLIRRFVEFLYIEYNGKRDLDENLFNDLVVYGLLTAMLYLFVFNEFYWNAIQERIFNRGILRRMISYLIYFWFNGYLVMELLECLCVNEMNERKINNNYISMNFVILYGFVSIVICLWFKLQDTTYIHVEQFKLNEICGFIIIIWINYGMCFGALEYKRKITEDVLNKPYVLLVLTAILLLHKFFYL